MKEKKINANVMQKLVMDFDIFVLFCFWQKQKETIAKPFIFFTQKKKLKFSQFYQQQF